MAGKTPHSHWDHYDENNEAASWNALHKLALEDRATFNAAPLPKRLVELAYSCGYGEADSHIASFGLEASEDESEEVAAHRQMFASYEDGDYYNCIDRSENVLVDAVGRDDEETVRTIRTIAMAQRDAYQAGRDNRIEQAQAPAPA